MRQRSEVLFLAEMLEALRKIRQIRKECPEDVNTWPSMHIDSLLWNFTVLGEAANKLSVEFTDRFSDVPWRKPISLRNRIVHGYWSVDLDTLQRIIDSELDDLEKKLYEVHSSLSRLDG